MASSVLTESGSCWGEAEELAKEDEEINREENIAPAVEEAVVVVVAVGVRGLEKGAVGCLSLSACIRVSLFMYCAVAVMQVSRSKKGKPVCSSFLLKTDRTISAEKPIFSVAFIMSRSMRRSNSLSVMVVWAEDDELVFGAAWDCTYKLRS